MRINLRTKLLWRRWCRRRSWRRRSSPSKPSLSKILRSWTLKWSINSVRNLERKFSTQVKYLMESMQMVTRRKVKLMRFWKSLKEESMIWWNLTALSPRHLFKFWWAIENSPNPLAVLMWAWATKKLRFRINKVSDRRSKIFSRIRMGKMILQSWSTVRSIDRARLWKIWFHNSTLMILVKEWPKREKVEVDRCHLQRLILKR